jgi:hypothetical protein
MISTFWNNVARGQQLLILSGDTLAKQQVINLKDVRNRGELVGILLETMNKVASPGSAKTLTVFYAFSNKENRTPEQLTPAAGSQVLNLEDAAAGTIRSYSLPINYQGGDYLHIWFTASTFTTPTAQLELDLSVLAKTYN